MKKIGVTCAGIGILVALNFADDFKVEVSPVHFGAFSYVGVIEARGDTSKSYGTTGEPIRNQPYSRFGGWVGMDATIEDRTEVSVLLAMMTFNSLPLTTGSPFTRMQSLGSNLGYGFISHKLGDPKSPWLTIKAGAFPYGYSNSKNLGGYLFTGGTYPGTLTGNFWTLIDGNDYAAQGAMGHFSFLEDALKIDATLFFEHGLEPNYDLSPGIVASYNLLGLVEIGAGAVFSHLIAWDEKAVTPKLRSNSYTGSNTSGQRLPVSDWNKPGLESTDTLIVQPGDPRLTTGTVDPNTRPDLTAKGLPVKYYTAAENGTPNSQLEYYTFRGTKVMGRIAVTPFTIGDAAKKVSLYSEVNLLGVQDYPFFYEKKSERMPIMIGANIPLPGGYEVTAEAEHYKNKFQNNVHTVYEFVVPQWEESQSSFFEPARDANGSPIPDGNGGFVPSTTPRDSHENGEWFWNFEAKKTFYDHITFTGKVAHDFLRLYNFFGNPSSNPVFEHNYGWYFAFKSQIAF
ncbi:MAG: hypothetical protein ABI036_20790 [Fibrobacteria bacterium]